jgi:hypothetical protein
MVTETRRVCDIHPALMAALSGTAKRARRGPIAVLTLTLIVGRSENSSTNRTTTSRGRVVITAVNPATSTVSFVGPSNVVRTVTAKLPGRVANAAQVGSDDLPAVSLACRVGARVWRGRTSQRRPRFASLCRGILLAGQAVIFLGRPLTPSFTRFTGGTGVCLSPRPLALARTDRRSA